MRLKYYLRGLGIGIIVTVIVLTIANAGKKASLSDEEIMTRAEQLGMLRPEEDEEEPGVREQENGEEPGVEGQENGEEPDKKEPGVVDVLNVLDVLGSIAEGSQSLNETNPSIEGTKDQNDNSTEVQIPGVVTLPENGNEEEPQYFAIEINVGEYSDRVSQKLLEAGLIDDAEGFNHFLVENGFDNRLTVGVHQILSGSSWEEIAQQLCVKPEQI